MGDLFTDGEHGQLLIRDAYEVLDEAYEAHRPAAIACLFSGGHDSLTACTVGMEWAAEREIAEPVFAAHIETGTGVPQTTQFVRDTCEREGWELRIYQPPVSYEEIVKEYGFPGPGQHGLMYQRLKERCLRQLVRDHKRRFQDRIMLVTGVRQEESVRRMRHIDRIQREGAQVWAAAIWNWDKTDCSRFTFAERGMARNEVVDLCHMSGECRCGAFARPGELDEWLQWFPDETEWILDLQKEVHDLGLRGWQWGKRPPRIHREQMAMLFGDDYDAGVMGPLCVGCEEAGDVEEP